MKYVLISLLIIAFFSCSEKVQKNNDTEKAKIYFKSVPADSSGIYFSNNLLYSDELNIIEYLYYYNGGGVALGDINNDGLDDIYLTANQSLDRLYLNLGNLKFKDITEKAGIMMDSTWSSGVTMEDVNNDGYLDIYVSKVGNYKKLKSHNLLYINNGDNSFDESSKTYGIDFSGLSTQASFFDYDNDGDMDMYLMNHSIHSVRSYGTVKKRQMIDSLSGDRLYENRLSEGIVMFENVTAQAGIYSSPLGYGLALATADINDDGLIDIYVGNDFHENDYFYLNQGDKTFKMVSDELFTHTSRFTMGVDIADINNDLKSDIFTLDMMPFEAEIFLKSAGEDSDKVARIKKNYGFGDQYAHNAFQLNVDNTSFSEIALMTGTYASDWSWSPLIQDYDNDGKNDIYVTNGIYKRPNDLDYINFISTIDFAQYKRSKQDSIEKRLIEKMPTLKIPNVVYRNKGDLIFNHLSSAAGLEPSYSNGAAYSDLDNDGDLDLVVNNLNQKAFLLENISRKDTTTNYVSFTVQGDSLFKNTSGTKIIVYADAKAYTKQQNVTKGFQSSSTRKIHFGLGRAKNIDSLQIFWLDGESQKEYDIALNEHHVLKRKESAIQKSPNNNPTNKSNFENFPAYHLENNFLDYEAEILMPEKLSTEGPAVVKADFTGDGLYDLYIGGARYQAPEYFVQQADGSFLRHKTSVFSKDVIYEDVDATSFDMENDGDLDLYVMSGGNDRNEENLQLEDRIYVNDGKGNFTRLNSTLIRTNGGSVSSTDFDGDGYDDLFIGNRSIPGGYGLSPSSYILKNDGSGKFGILQQERIGMVTDSQWADINNDGLQDLVIAGDWMPITILINQGESRFLNETKKFGLDHTTGMWNTIEIADIDSNGQLDILAGNAGLNFKMKASEERPIKLYIDDYDKNGRPEPLIFYDFFGKYVPFASKDKLLDQLPYLRKKFLSYADFSKITTVEDLTGRKENEILEIKRIEELRSMAYFNPGKNLRAVALPREAQMSTIEDFELSESGALLYVGNFLGYTNELGQSSANSGGILKIQGQDKIKTVGRLPLPMGLNTRRIIHLRDDRYLVISNNDKAYIIRQN